MLVILIGSFTTTLTSLYDVSRAQVRPDQCLNAYLRHHEVCKQPAAFYSLPRSKLHYMSSCTHPATVLN
jgi:hypothetical protein